VSGGVHHKKNQTLWSINLLPVTVRSHSLHSLKQTLSLLGSDFYCRAHGSACDEKMTRVEVVEFENIAPVAGRFLAGFGLAFHAIH